SRLVATATEDGLKRSRASSQNREPRPRALGGVSGTLPRAISSETCFLIEGTPSGKRMGRARGSPGVANLTLTSAAARKVPWRYPPLPLLLPAGGFLHNQLRDPIVALAARHQLPAMSFYPVCVEAGGLFCSTSSLFEAGRQAGVYAGRILKGAKPADLPVT